MKARKKPIVVDVWQLDIFSVKPPLWVVDAITSGRLLRDGNKWLISTLEGDMEAYNEDYLIKGVRGELYPCAKEIFEETYDILED